MDYQSFPFKFANTGLDLRDIPDILSEGSWVTLTNASSLLEGLLATRPGVASAFATGGGGVHSLRRLTDSTLLIGAGDSLYRNTLAYPTTGYSGNPLSLVTWRPSISSAPWAYIADSLKMRKVDANGNDFQWGIRAPQNAITFGATGAVGNLDSSVAGGIVYDWRSTYYSTLTGAESNPSPIASGISVVLHPVNVTVAASSDPQVDQIRVYRRGGTLADWILSLTSPNVSGDLLDNNADSTIAANEIISEDREVPFTSLDSAGNALYEVPLPYVWGPFLGKYLLACGAPNQPGYVFWTNPELPDEASVENNIEITNPSEPLQNGLIFASLPYVASKSDWYALDFGSGGGATFQGRKTPVGKGLAAPWAFCANGPLVYFLANDGIYETDFTGSARSITEERLRPLFQEAGSYDLSPIDYSQSTKLRMNYFQNEVWFAYQDTEGAARLLIYNTIYQRWRSTTPQVSTWSPMLSDDSTAPATLYIGAANGTVYSQSTPIALATDAGATIPVSVRTAAIDFGSPTNNKQLGNLLLDANPNGGTITVTPYYNTTTSGPSFALTGNNRQIFSRPLATDDPLQRNVAIGLAWDKTATANPFIYQMNILWRPDAEPLRHWQFITTHGIHGWQHIRDLYLVLRSTSVVSLTILVDSAAYGPYNIPSTSGARLKNYIQVDPTKGKVFTYTLTAANDFYLYGSECEVLVKPWNTNVGYQLTSPFNNQVVEA